MNVNFKSSFLISTIVIHASCMNSENSGVTNSDVKNTDTVSQKVAMRIDEKFDVSDKAPKYVVVDSVLFTYDQMKNLLPDLEGYKKKGTPSGEGYAKRTSGGMQSYIKQEYEKNNNIILLEIIDYRLATEVFAGMVKMYERNIKVKKADEYSSLISSEIPDVKAISTVYPNTNSSRLVLATDNNFLIIVTAEGTQQVKKLMSIAKKVPLQELLDQN